MRAGGGDDVTDVVVAERRVAELRALLRDVERAVGNVPGLERPTGALGAVGVWRGPAADAAHADLVPLDQRLRVGLPGLVASVRAELGDAEADLRRARAAQGVV